MLLHQHTPLLIPGAAINGMLLRRQQHLRRGGAAQALGPHRSRLAAAATAAGQPRPRLRCCRGLLVLRILLRLRLRLLHVAWRRRILQHCRRAVLELQSPQRAGQG